MRAWVNGRLLDDPGAPALPVSDHGFTVGDGVFESVKVVSGTPFALTRHLDRLAVSAAGLGLPVPASPGSAAATRAFPSNRTSSARFSASCAASRSRRSAWPGCASCRRPCPARRSKQPKAK